MNFTPYPHQQAGIDWITQRPACALLWGMGTGKTVTTLTAIDRLLYDGLEPGPVLVLYAYKHDADRIRKRISCRALDRPEDIDAWNRGEIPVAIAHPASIGHGLNLQEGGHITIWYGLTWSLELYQQANERLNRPGQKNVCRVYHLIMKGTHDERVLKALGNKDKGQAAAIEALRLEITKEKIND